MLALRTSTLLLSSFIAVAILTNAAACSSTDPASESATSGSGAGTSTSSGGQGGAGSTASSGSNGAGGGASSCPQADTMLDVSKAPGAGGTYEKPSVTAACTDTMFIVDSNGMPTYTFVATTPNPLKPVQVHWEITRTPKEEPTTTSLPLLATIGFSVNGLPIFTPNEAGQPADQAYGDPIYNGIMDPCFGHTADQYHYHSLLEKCLIDGGLVDKPWMNADPPGGSGSPIIGWALDGFPIYGPRECADAACSKVSVMQSGYEKIGDPKTNAWDAYAYKDHAGDPTFLDECNGHHGPDGDYHYHATSGFPYVIGCFRGKANISGGMMGPKSCVDAADCSTADACPPGSKGCTCASSPMGMICAPTCSTAADCPMGPMGALKCNMGVCVP